MDKYNQIKELLNGLETDFNKFYGAGNKAAGVRIRKAMQELKALAQEVRVAISEAKEQ